MPQVVVTGPKTKPVGLLYNKDYLMLKVAFHPTGTYRFLNVAMQQLVNAGIVHGEPAVQTIFAEKLSLKGLNELNVLQGISNSVCCFKQYTKENAYH